MNAEGGIFTTGYDKAGNITFALDPRGQGATISYDSANRLTLEVFTDASRSTYTYDNANNRLTASSSAGIYTSTYDPRNLLQSLQEPGGKFVTYTYDAAQRRVSMNAYGKGLFTYTWDAANRQTKVTSPTFKTTTMSYDGLGQLLRRQYSNNAVTTQLFDGARNLQQIINTLPTGSLVSRFTYTYDKANHRKTQLEDDSTRTTWTYDRAYQLLNEKAAGGPANTSFNVTHSYDPAGNRILSNDGTTITTYSYSAANRLTLAVANGARTTYSYDLAGNRTKQQSPTQLTMYNWDAAGRMISVDITAGAVTFTYNADGQRVAKEGTSGSVTGFLYDHKKLLHETDSADNILKTYTTTTNEEYGDLISETGETYHQYDAQANTNALIDDTPAIDAKYKYFAYGEVSAVNIGGGTAWTKENWSSLPLSLSSDMMAGGQKQYYLDLETALYLLGTGTRGRYYDPATARFMSEDPIRHQAGDPNLFAYVQNDPINNLDPSGEGGEGVTQAEGRVKGQAVEEHVMSRIPGSRNQQRVDRTYNGVTNTGTKADLRIGERYSEVGPASPSGLQLKLHQLDGIDATKRGDVYLYKQEKTVPTTGDKVEYVRLSYKDAKSIYDDVKAGTISRDKIWEAAKQKAGSDVYETVVSDKAAEQAGRIYRRGVKISDAQQPASKAGAGEPTAGGQEPHTGAEQPAAGAQQPTQSSHQEQHKAEVHEQNTQAPDKAGASEHGHDPQDRPRIQDQKAGAQEQKTSVGNRKSGIQDRQNVAGAGHSEGAETPKGPQPKEGTQAPKTRPPSEAESELAGLEKEALARQDEREVSRIQATKALLEREAGGAKLTVEEEKAVIRAKGALENFSKAKKALAIVGFAAYVTQAVSDGAQGYDFTKAFANPNTARGQFFRRAMEAASNLQNGQKASDGFLNTNSPLYQNTLNELKEFMRGAFRLSPATGDDLAEKFMNGLSDRLRARINQGNAMIDKIEAERKNALHAVEHVATIPPPIDWGKAASHIRNQLVTRAEQFARIARGAVDAAKGAAEHIMESAADRLSRLTEKGKQMWYDAQARAAREQSSGMHYRDTDGRNLFVPAGRQNLSTPPSFRPDNAPGHWEKSEQFHRWVYVFDKPPLRSDGAQRPRDPHTEDRRQSQDQ